MAEIFSRYTSVKNIAKIRLLNFALFLIFAYNLNMENEIIVNVIKVFLPAVIAFIVGICFTPFWTDFLYKHKMWKKKSGKKSGLGDDNGTPIFNELHKEKEVNTPRLGGVVIWFSVLATVLLFWILAVVFNNDTFIKLAFFSRSQTWIPIVCLIIGAAVGLVDDWMEINGTGKYIAGGLSLKKRLACVGILGLLVACWFYFRLDVSTIGLPFLSGIDLSWLFIPFFIMVVMFIYSGGIIDGLDGLAGGVFAIIFSGYSLVAFFQGQIDLAAFCATMVGGLLAFLWFNIPPARFYMTETGSMALTVTLAVVAFITDFLSTKTDPTARGGYGVLMLLVIAFPLIVTSLSNIVQVFSKKFFHRKIFLVAPLHHHFEAIGWSREKVVMRYWVVSIVLCVLGVVLALIG